MRAATRTPGPDGHRLRTRAQPGCLLCGAAGETLHRELSDGLYGTPGQWTLVRCPAPGCGLIWLDPMPQPQDLWMAYQRYYTHTPLADRDNGARRGRLARSRDAYLRVFHGYPPPPGPGDHLRAWFVRAVPILRTAAEFEVFSLPYRPQGRLLEVGCGNGRMLRRLNALGWQAEGQEVDPAAVAIARAAGLTVHEGPLEVLDLPPESYDAVVMSHVMEHVPDPRELLRQGYRLLKSGGVLVSVTPNTSSLGHRWFGRFWLNLDPPRHLYLFSAPCLSRLLGGTRFRSWRIDSSIRYADGTFIASRRLSRGRSFSPSDPLPPLSRIAGRVAQLGEWASLAADPFLGEELVLKAWK